MSTVWDWIHPPTRHLVCPSSWLKKSCFTHFTSGSHLLPRIYYGMIPHRRKNRKLKHKLRINRATFTLKKNQGQLGILIDKPGCLLVTRGHLHTQYVPLLLTSSRSCNSVDTITRQGGERTLIGCEGSNPRDQSGCSDRSPCRVGNGDLQSKRGVKDK